MPKGLVTLEGIFNYDGKTKSRGLNLATSKDDHIPIPIFYGRTLNLGKVCSKIEQENFINLCQEFNDVISWTYEDLKGFDPSLF